MAIVIHEIKNNFYAYEHHRVGDKIVCDYLGRYAGGGSINEGTREYHPGTESTIHETGTHEHTSQTEDGSIGSGDQIVEGQPTQAVQSEPEERQKTVIERGLNFIDIMLDNKLPVTENKTERTRPQRETYGTETSTSGTDGSSSSNETIEQEPEPEKEEDTQQKGS